MGHFLLFPTEISPYLPQPDPRGVWRSKGASTDAQPAESDKHNVKRCTGAHCAAFLWKRKCDCRPFHSRPRGRHAGPHSPLDEHLLLPYANRDREKCNSGIHTDTITARQLEFVIVYALAVRFIRSRLLSFIRVGRDGRGFFRSCATDVENRTRLCFSLY